MIVFIQTFYKYVKAFTGVSIYTNLDIIQGPAYVFNIYIWFESYPASTGEPKKAKLHVKHYETKNELSSCVLTSYLVLGQKGQLSYNQDNEHKAEK